MGQDISSPIDENVPAQSLKDRSLESVAKYISDGHAKNIVVLAGAGISTAAGIPDFRSPDTGLYANLARLALPNPEAVFDIGFFRSNPIPFYTLAHELRPGQFQPTLAHFFVRMLSDKGLLLKLFTQNIDCLDLKAGVPPDKIVEAHGSFANQHCIDCKHSYPSDMMESRLNEKSVPHCESCGGLVKPDIVFFGESLPEAFHQNRMLPSKADLCIVMGTSLTVQPFASLPDFCSEGIPRLLLNLVKVGSFGSRADDVIVLDECDSAVRRLVGLLDWTEDLGSILKRAGSGAAKSLASPSHSSSIRLGSLDQEVARLAQEIDESLELSDQHVDRVLKDLSNDPKESDLTKIQAGHNRLHEPSSKSPQEKEAAYE